MSPDDMALEPSEVSSPAPRSPPLSPSGVVRSHDTGCVKCFYSKLRCVEFSPAPFRDSISDMVSVSRGIEETVVTENGDSDVEDNAAPPKVDTVCYVFCAQIFSPLTVYYATRITRARAKRHQATESLLRQRPQRC